MNIYKDKIEPEEYDEFGNIIKTEIKQPYTRVMNSYNQHRIHETKDLIDTNCYRCQKMIEETQKRWSKNNA